METQNPLQLHAKTIRNMIELEASKYHEVIQQEKQFSEAKMIRDRIRHLEREYQQVLMTLDMKAALC